MGLNASSDKWCCHSDRIVMGLPWAKKIIDDTIIWAPTLEELQERATIILEQCQDLNITISQSVWDAIKEGAKSTQYTNLQTAVEKGGSDPGTSQFKTLMHRLSLRQIDDVFIVILDSTRMVIPDNSQKAVLKELPHSGISMTYATAV